MTIQAVADQTGIPRSTVYEALKREGIPRRPDCPRRTVIAAEAAARITGLYQRGLSVAAVAAETGAMRWQVHRVVTEAGIARPRPSLRHGEAGTQ